MAMGGRGVQPCESLDANQASSAGSSSTSPIPWYVALIGVARSLPLFAFGLFAGLIADRTNRWLVMLCAQSVNALMTGILLALLLSNAVQPWHVFLLALILGCGTTLDIPSQRSLISTSSDRSRSSVPCRWKRSIIRWGSSRPTGRQVDDRDDRLRRHIRPADGRPSLALSLILRVKSTCPAHRDLPSLLAEPGRRAPMLHARSGRAGCPLSHSDHECPGV